MTVQDDDLDEYGVVNNAIYASYIHRGISVKHGDNSSALIAFPALERGLGGSLIDAHTFHMISILSTL